MDFIKSVPTFRNEKSVNRASEHVFLCAIKKQKKNRVCCTLVIQSRLHLSGRPASQCYYIVHNITYTLVEITS